jgi:hypothetical protein
MTAWLSSIAEGGAFIKNAPAEKTGNIHVSPTQLTYYSEGSRLEAEMGVYAVQQRPADDEDQANNANGTNTSIYYSEAASPSISYSLEAKRLNRYNKRILGGVEISSVVRYTELNLDSSFKILDAYVFGLGYGYHLREKNPRSNTEKTSNPSRLSVGFAYKTDLWLTGFGYKSIYFEGRRYVEYVLHGRYMINTGTVAGFHMREYPQEACCDLSLSKRMEYALSWESNGPINKWEFQAVHRPAFDTGVEAEISKNYLNLLYMLSGHRLEGIGIKGQYGNGTGTLRETEMLYEKLALSVVYFKPF